MRFSLAALTSSFCAVHAFGQGLSIGQDLIFVVDQSRSIDDQDAACLQSELSLTCMEQIAHFVNQTSFRLIELAGSTYKSPVEDGIRVGVVMFRCGEGKEGRRVVLNPTGDITEILAGMKLLKELIPNQGSTCAAGALKHVKDVWIPDQPTPNRKTSIVMCTDGFVSDHAKTLEVSDELLNSPYTSTYGVLVGSSAAGTAKTGLYTQDPNKVFNVKDAQSLNSISDSISRFVFGDFRISVDGSNSTLCSGSSVAVAVKGNSVANQTDGVILEAVLTIEGLIIKNEGTRFPGGFSFELAGIFLDGSHEAKIEILNTADGRRLGNVVFLNLTFAGCAAVVADVGSSRCLGSSFEAAFSGITISRVLELSQATTQTCIVEYNTEGYTKNFPATASGNSYTCQIFEQAAAAFDIVNTTTLPLSNISYETSTGMWKTADPSYVTGIRFRISSDSGTLPGSNSSFVEFEIEPPAQSLKPDLTSTTCVSSSTPVAVCWRKPTLALFTGSVINWIPLPLGCVFDVNGELTLVNAAIVGGEAQCDYPANLLEPSSSRTLKVTLVAMDISKNLLLAIEKSEYAANEYTLNSCISIEAQEERCFGEPVQITIGSPHVSLDSSTGVSCEFQDELNFETIGGTLRSDGNGNYICEVIGAEPYSAMDSVSIRSNGVLLLKTAIQGTATACFQMSIIDRQQTRYELASNPDVETCWGSGETYTVYLSGRSASFLFAQSREIRLNIDDRSRVVVPQQMNGVYDLPSNAYKFQVPQSFLHGNGGATVVKLIVSDAASSKVLYNSQLNFRLLTSSPCFDAIYINRNDMNNTDLCMGTKLDLSFTGTSVASLNILATSSDAIMRPQNFSFTYSSSSVVALPDNFLFPENFISVIEIDLSNGFTVSIALPNPETSKDAPDCYETIINVQAAVDGRRVLQSSDEYCLGDGLSASFGGQSVLALVNNGYECECSWISSSTKSAEVSAYATGRCVSPSSWSPFATDAGGSFDNVVLHCRKDPSSSWVAAGSPLDMTSGPYQAKVCADNFDWGDVAAEESSCMRSSVTVGMSGRSAYMLKTQPSKVRCNLFNTNGSMAVVNPAFSGSRVACVAPGWSPLDTTSGNYSAIEIVVILADNSTRVVKRSDIAATAEVSCIDIVAPTACVGEPLNLELTGPTLSAYQAADPSGKLSCVGDINDETQSITNSSAGVSNTFACNGIVSNFVPGLFKNASIEFKYATFTLPVRYKGKQYTVLPSLPNILTESNCVRKTSSSSSCTGPSQGSVVEFDGVTSKLASVNPNLVSYLACEFTSSDFATSIKVPAVVSSEGMSCSSGNGYYYFELLANDFSVFSGVTTNDVTSGCLAATAGTTAPTSSDSDSIGLIVGLSCAGAFFVALVALVVVKKKQKRNQSPGDVSKPHDVENPETGEKDIALLSGAVGGTGFREGDRVEARGAFDFSNPADDLPKWYKGTVRKVSDVYDVELDHLGTVVSTSNLQRVRSDFAQNSLVEVQDALGDAWNVARVTAIFPDDHYMVEYIDPSLSKESVVGTCVRLFQKSFKPGDFVEFPKSAIDQLDISTGKSRGIIEREEDALTYRVNVDDQFYSISATVLELFRVHVDEIVLVLNERAKVISFDHNSALVDYLDRESSDREKIPMEKISRLVFSIGDLVEVSALAVSHEGEKEVVSPEMVTLEEWGKGTVSDCEFDGTHYTIAFQDSSTEVVHMNYLRLQTPLFNAGEAVEVENGDTWMKATVTKVNSNGTFDLLYAEGKTEAGVAARRMRAVTVDFILFENDQENTPYLNVWRPPPRQHSASEDDGLEVPYHLRFRKKKALEFHELPGNCFQVTLDMSQGLGLSLGWTNDRRVIVAGFRDLPNGDWGPVEACGLVGLKDQLIEVNTINIVGKSFVEVGELIKKSGKSISLQFGRATDEAALTLNQMPPTTA